MKIVVCIKQVPGTSQVEIDPETGVLKRDGAAAKINPYDLYALETAMRLKERCGGTVTAVTMGPPQAEAMMKEAYMMGVDQAYVFTDRTFAGADVLAQQLLRKAVQCSVHRRHLHQNIGAVNILFHHCADPAHLTLDAAQSVDKGTVLLGSAVLVAAAGGGSVLFGRRSGAAGLLFSISHSR